MERPAIVFLGALFAAGCDSLAVNRFELSGLDLELGFVALVDPQNRVTRPSNFFGITPDQKISFGELPRFDLAESETRTVLVALDNARFSQAIRGFDAPRASELAVLPTAPPESPELNLKNGRSERGTVEIAIPAGADFFVVTHQTSDEVLKIETAPDDLRAAMREQLRLAVPVDFEYCRIPGASELRRIAGAPATFGPTSGPAAEHFRDIVRLDENRIILVSWGGIYLVRTDRDYVRTADNYLELARNFLPATAAALDPRPRSDGRAQLVVAGGLHDAPIGPQGAFWFVSAGEDDLRLEYSSPTLTDALYRPAVGRDGRILISSQSAPHLYERPAGETDFRWVDLPSRTAPNDETAELIATADDEYPFVTGTRGRIHMWRTSLRQWINEDIEQPGIFAFEKAEPRSLATFGTGNNFQVWVGSQYGQVYRRGSQAGWTRYEIPLPPRGYPCSKADMPAPLGALPEVNALAANGDRLFASMSDCTALFVIEPNFECSAVFARPEEEIVHMGTNVATLRVFDGSLLVAGDHGVLLESTW